MDYEKYNRRRKQLLDYLDGGVLNTTLGKPTKAELAEQVFFGQLAQGTPDEVLRDQRGHEH